MDYKSFLKSRISEGILHFCEVCILDDNNRLVSWKVISSNSDELAEGIAARQSIESLFFLAVLQEQSQELRECRLILILQDRSITAAGRISGFQSSYFQTVLQTISDPTNATRFFSFGLQPDTVSGEYWRKCRKFIGHDNLFSPAAGAMVTDGQGRYLLQRRGDDGTWGILGGSLELGETICEAAVREVFEESGLKVHLLRLLSVATGKDCAIEYPNGDKLGFWGFLFLAEVIGGEIISNNEESLELKWFTYAEIENLPNKNQYLEHNFRNVQNTEIRVTSK